MSNIAVPISHLFKNPDFARQIVEVSDCLEAREHSEGHFEKPTEAFHFDIQPIHELEESDFDFLSSIKKRESKLKLISFHLASSCNKPMIKNGIFIQGGKNYSESELLRSASYNFEKIRDIFGGNVVIAVENNNYYNSEAYRYVTDASFIKKIVQENDIFFLYDMAHAKVTAHNRGIQYGFYRDQLPLDRIVQVHISGFSIDPDGRAFDSHNYPDDQDFIEVSAILKKYDVKYLTPEYYKDVEGLLRIISRIRKMVN